MNKLIKIFYLWTFLMTCADIHVFGMRIVDLSHNLDENAITWPVNPRFKLQPMFQGWWQPGIWLENNNLSMAEHTGTHVDAPLHFAKDAWAVHQVPLDRLFGPGVIVNVKDKVKENIDYEVTIADMLAWEKKHGKIPNGAVVFMNSGWDVRYGDFKRAFGTEYPRNITENHYPGWHLDTVKWLINKRGLKVLGGDTPSFENGPAINNGFPVHLLVSKEGICGCESVANLDKIPESGATIFVPMLKIKNGSGAGARIFATINDDDGDRGSATKEISHTWLLLFSVFLCLFQTISK